MAEELPRVLMREEKKMKKVKKGRKRRAEKQKKRKEIEASRCSLAPSLDLGTDPAPAKSPGQGENKRPVHQNIISIRILTTAHLLTHITTAHSSASSSEWPISSDPQLPLTVLSTFRVCMDFAVSLVQEQNMQIE